MNGTHNPDHRHRRRWLRWPARGRSVRARAALAAALALTPVLLGAAVAGVLLQRHELTNAVALVALEQAGTLARYTPETTTPDPTTIDRTTQNLVGEETLVQVVSADGGVIDSSAVLAGLPALLGAPDEPRVLQGRETGLVDGEEDTYLTVAVGAVGGGYVVAARSLEPVDTAAASTTRLFAAGVPLLIAVVAALSWALAGRALRPVESLTSRASEITAFELGARLPDVATGDEVEHLASTLNQMLSRLDASARAQRRFVADASHELRSPVTTIRTVMEVATKTGDDAGPVTDWDEVSSDVLLETARLERIVNGLLELARRDIHDPTPTTTPLEPVDIVDLARVELRRPRRLAISALLPDGPVLVAGDREALASVLTNLVENADRHGATHVKIEVTPAPEGVELRVTDDGRGIPADEAERGLRPFCPPRRGAGP